MASAAVSTVVWDGIGNAMNPAGSTGRIIVNASSCAAANTQRRWKMALMPLATATALALNFSQGNRPLPPRRCLIHSAYVPTNH
jgi:hypothetical protein